MPEIDRPWLEARNFEGFLTIGGLRRTDLNGVPWYSGVYVVLRDALGPAEFVSVSSGGWFKGRNPDVAANLLQAKWIDNAYVLYIGKADAGASGGRGLRQRIGEYLRFGRGEPIGHWGGRYLWHLADTLKLLVAWREADPAGSLETALMQVFAAEYGRLPFANLRK
jgi:hypothetical protein